MFNKNFKKITIATVTLSALLWQNLSHAQVKPDATGMAALRTLGSDYESLSAAEKMDVLMTKLIESQYVDGILPQDPVDATVVEKLTIGSRIADMRERNRVFEKGDSYDIADKIDRITHYLGSVVQVKFTPTLEGKAKFSGFFAADESLALMRFSSAVGVKVNPPRTPSIGLKFLINGNDPYYGTSVNAVFISEVNGFGYPDGDKAPLPLGTPFFTKDLAFSTKLSDTPDRPGAKNILYPAFASSVASTTSTSAWGNHLSTMGIASYNSVASVDKSAIKNPFIVMLKPAGKLLSDTFQKGDHSHADYREQLNELKEGDLLFNVYAQEKSKTDPEILIATISANSGNINSAFGDYALRFQHDVDFHNATDLDHVEEAVCPFTGRKATGHNFFYHNKELITYGAIKFKIEQKLAQLTEEAAKKKADEDSKK